MNNGNPEVFVVSAGDKIIVKQNVRNTKEGLVTS